MKNWKYILLNCKNCGQQYKTYKAQIKLYGSSYCSRRCMGESYSKIFSGVNSPSWRGGRATKERCIRNSTQWKKWREAVFARDNWTCQDCGQVGGNLEPHHIKPFAYFSKLRFEVSNGITLCKKCHRKTKTNGKVMRKNYKIKNYTQQTDSYAKNFK